MQISPLNTFGYVYLCNLEIDGKKYKKVGATSNWEKRMGDLKRFNVELLDLKKSFDVRSDEQYVLTLFTELGFKEVIKKTKEYFSYSSPNKLPSLPSEDKRSEKNPEYVEALAYVKKIIKSFGFTMDELDLSIGRHVFSSGAVGICRKIILDQPGIRRREFLEKAAALGVNKPTASTQFCVLKKIKNKQSN